MFDLYSGNPQQNFMRNMESLARFNPDMAKSFVSMFGPSFGIQPAGEALFATVPPEVAQGEIGIGISHSGIPVYLSGQDVAKPVAVFGETGSGKTTLLMSMILQYVRYGVRVVVFEFLDDYRKLLPIIPDLLYFRVAKDFRFNPLEMPEGSNPTETANSLSTLFCSAYSIMTGGHYYLTSHYIELYKRFRTFEDKNRVPSFLDSYEYLAGNQPKWGTDLRGYWERIMVRLQALCSSFESTFDCSKGFALKHLLDYNLVFDLSSASPEDQGFMVSALMNAVFKALPAGSSSYISHAVFVDEADKIFGRKDGHGGKGDTYDIFGGIANTIRHRKVGLEIATQEPSRLIQHVKANTPTKIMLGLGDTRDMNEASSMLGMNRQQMEIFSSIAEPGLCVVRLGSRHRMPMLVQFPPISLPDGVADEDIESRMRSYEYLLRYEPRHAEQVSAAVQEHRQEAKQEQVKKTHSQMHDLLRNVAERPTYAKMERRAALAQLGFSQNEANAILDNAVRDGYLRTVAVSVGRGRPLELTELTEEGRKFLEREGYQTPKQTRGGARHLFWQERIEAYYKARGYQAWKEKYFEAVRDYVDVLAVKDGYRIAVEVAVGHEYESINIQKALDIGFDEIIVACDSDEVMERLSAHSDMVRLVMARDLVREAG